MEMLTFSFNFESKVPIYFQLYEYIKSEIQSGRIGCNTKLPSKRRLSEHLGISQNTVQAAYEQLIEEGYVTAIARKGFYVSKIENIVKIDIAKENRYSDRKNKNSSLKYDFSYNSVDIENFPFTIWRKFTKEAINEYDRDLMQICDSRGDYNLRNAIADYLRQSRGVDCSADQIIISSGTEYLFQILIQLLGENCIYGIENPGYEKLNLLFKSSHAEYKPLKIDSNGMMLEEIEKSNADVICIAPSHQFPSGMIMPIGRRIQILNWANQKNGRYIVEDDYDSEFKYSGKPIPSLQGIDKSGKVIYMGAFSKSLTPSLRISYMILPEKLIEEYNSKLSFLICPVPVIEQKVLTRFISEGCFERHLNKMRNVYKKKREFLVDKISSFNGPVEILGADAGLHIVLKIKNGMSEGQLIKSALEKGVKVYGISRYYSDKSDIGKIPEILLGYAAMTEEEISGAIDKLAEAWFLTDLRSGV